MLLLVSGQRKLGLGAGATGTGPYPDGLWLWVGGTRYVDCEEVAGKSHVE